MSSQYGFELIRDEVVNEIDGRARIYRHEATGAQVLSIACEDENKVFGAGFRTPPADSTGVAHILEHSVLCGSSKYPVKEPFVELLKGSLQTFLNAFTYPDKTCYPVASTNEKDFYNLVDVYLDAVLHPRLGKQIFQQEGWHYELDAPEDPLTIKGVVYNEMKGAYSSPNSVLHEFSQRVLFPDTTYGLDSGGEPEVIPDLTLEQFEAFHSDYYHPANARFYFYGDDPEDKRLAKLAEFLREYGPRDVSSNVGLQLRFSEPVRAERKFAAGDDDGHMITVGWLLPQVTERETALALEVLEHILIGLPSSPLRRELMESGLGEDLAGAGLETEIRQMYFSIGMKGLAADGPEQVEKVIFDVLKRLAEEGPHPHAVEAAMNSMEFDLREMNTGRFPRGLALMLRTLTNWLYDADPLEPLAWEKEFAALKARVESGEPVFQDIIREHFLDNPHRATLVLVPDTDLAARREERERERLAEIKAGMSQSEIEAVIAQSKELKDFQETPDSPEALASIPVLSVSDVKPEEEVLPQADKRLAETSVLFHDLQTKGIVYLDLGLDLRVVPQEFLPLVGIFGRSLFEMGTKRDGLFGLTMRVARKTGGIHALPYTASCMDTDEPAARLFLRGKATAENGEELLDILRDVLMETEFDNKDRFRRLVLEEKARMEQRLIPAGHMVVMSRLRARSGAAGWSAELMSGVSALFTMRELLKAIDEDWQGVLARLEELRRLFLCRPRMLVNVTCEEKDYKRFEPALARLLEALPGEAASDAPWTVGELPKVEGLTLPAQVNYVGKGLDLSKAGYQFKGSHLACVKHARMAWLWDKIRVQGGAYGAFCSLDRFSGSFAFASYRDPNVEKTLAAFDGTAEYFKNLDLPREELEKAVIGAVGDVDAHMLPDAKGFAAMARTITGDTVQVRQKMRDELLAATPADFKDFGQAIAQGLDDADIVVLGSADAIDRAPLDFEVTKVL
jgi:hypothetical protein